MFLRRIAIVGFIILLSCGSLGAFVITTHSEVTKKALTDLESGWPALLQNRKFTPQATKEIVDANISMDTLDCSNDQRSDKNPALPCGYANLFDTPSWTGSELYSGSIHAEDTYPSDHFDDERFKDGNFRLMHYRSAAVAHLKTGNFVGARKELGLALHTLQDFYAHSNWVDLGLGCCIERLGFSDAFDTYKRYRIATPEEKTCRDPSTLLTLPENTLTTGYFPNSNEAIAKGKCAHGEPAKPGNPFIPDRGINKDSDWLYVEFAGPRYERFKTATNIAASHTTTFVKDVLTEGCGANRDCVLSFMGYPNTISDPPTPPNGPQSPVMRDCQEQLYEPLKFVSLVETLGERIMEWVKTDSELQRLVRQGTGQEVTRNIYAAGLLERVPDCTESVVHVLTGNQVPRKTLGPPPGGPGLTVVVKAMPWGHCEAMKLRGQYRFSPGMFAIRFEPPGPPTNYRLGECVANPVLTIMVLGKAMPQPNTAYLFFTLN